MSGEILNQLLDGFEGKVTKINWAKLTKCSHFTAFRDIYYLCAKASSSKTPRAVRAQLFG
jgi:hypothetical protein